MLDRNSAASTAASPLTATNRSWRRFELRLLIIAGFALMVLILIGSGIAALYGMRTIAESYRRQQAYANVLQVATDIEISLMNLRVTSKDFLASGKPEDGRKIQQGWLQLQARMAAGGKILTDAGLGDAVMAFRTRASTQRGHFERLSLVRADRRARSEVILDLGNRMLGVLEEVVVRAFEFGDFEGSNRASRLREGILAAKNAALTWLLIRAHEPVEPVVETWHDLVANARRVRLILKLAEDRGALGQVIEFIGQQEALLTELGRIIVQERGLEATLESEAELVQKLAQGIRERAIQGGSVLSAEVEKTWDTTTHRMLLFAIGSVLIGLLAAVHVYRRSVVPVHRMTEALSALSQGDLNREIPFTAAPNEVGEMARAADVFKRAMAESDQTRLVLQTVLDNMQDAMMVFDKDFRWSIWNPRLVEFQRLPPDLARVGVPGEDILRFQAERGDFGPGDVDAQIAERKERMLTPGGIRYHRRTVAGRYIEFNFKPLPDGRLLGYYRDLTEIKDREDEVQKATTRLRDAIESLSSGFTLYDADDRLVVWNQRFIELYKPLEPVVQVGVSFETVAREAVARGVIPEAAGREEDWIKKRLTIQSANEDLIVNRSDSDRWIQVNNRRTAAGNVVTVYTEITELKRREIELAHLVEALRIARDAADKARADAEAANRYKSNFLANMSHELRTPLNAVLGYTEMMIDGLYGSLPDKAGSVLQRVQSNGRHLLELINDVLDLAKIEAGQLQLTLGHYSVASLIESVVIATESLARTKGLVLESRIALDLPIGHGDERRLTQVLLNLIGNAIKFTDTGRVEVAASRDGDWFDFTVSDTGPGIDAVEQARIFEKFHQVDHSSTRRIGGSGLGLAISRHIVDMHGGQLSVMSELGKGSVFRMRIPINVTETRQTA